MNDKLKTSESLMCYHRFYFEFIWNAFNMLMESPCFVYNTWYVYMKKNKTNEI